MAREAGDVGATDENETGNVAGPQQDGAGDGASGSAADQEVVAARPSGRGVPAREKTLNPKKRRSPLGGLVEIVLTVAGAIVLALLIQAFLVKPYRIPSGSMLNTLHIGQRILVNRLSTHPGLGAIVVFHPPAGAEEGGDGVCANSAQGLGHSQACSQPTPQESNTTYVKRVVGLPGDRLQIRDGHVWRNGVEEHGSYVVNNCTYGPDCNFPQTITVPAGYYFMMGDNRGESDDSRFWGPVAQQWIVGTAFATYWPLDRIGIF